jgi:catechol 2,3-dioxygenase-like lactoylglutathione lyase family enzyme
VVKERERAVNWKLEVVVIPVSDIDRAKAFYADQLGFVCDHDTAPAPGVRIVQLTPPGSGCSIVIGRGAVPDMPPGSIQGLQLIIPDIRAARAELVGRGVEISPIQFFSPEGPRPATDDDDLNNGGFCFFKDPDGNGWALQEINTRP